MFPYHKRVQSTQCGRRTASRPAITCFAKGAAQVPDSPAHFVWDPLQFDVTSVIHCVAGLPTAIAGQSHAAGIDHGQIAECMHALNVGVPQNNDVAVQPSDTFAPLILGQVLEQVPWGVAWAMRKCRPFHSNQEIVGSLRRNWRSASLRSDRCQERVAVE